MMSMNDSNRNGSAGSPTQVVEPADSAASQAPTTQSAVREGSGEPVPKFATRTDVREAEGINKSKLILLGGGLAVAVLFFVFTAIVSKSPKKQALIKPSNQPAKKEQPKPPQGSVTPVMDTVRTPAPENTNGQLGPADIRRTRSLDASGTTKSVAGKRVVASSLGNVPSFADTQQKWEDPAPYNSGTPVAQAPQTQQNTLKEPSLIFVRSVVTQDKMAIEPKVNTGDDGASRLELTPGTRIQAKLETQISSAVQAPVVAVVEYTYAIGDKIIVPSGARAFGQLQQADRSGLISVKFDEIELLDGVREKIDAIATGLDLGPIKGTVYGKNTGKNFLVRAASGIGSVLAEVAGNNSSAAFSEDDMLRERLAENIGTAGDSEVMGLNANSRVVVSVPADTKIYVVFTKHETSPSELHKAAPTAQ
jgi:type IV secretory pathway VirB10-like protein